jgi:hypothetical protein
MMMNLFEIQLNFFRVPSPTVSFLFKNTTAPKKKIKRGFDGSRPASHIAVQDIVH